MFFLRSAATLRKSQIPRLEVPNNTPYSTHDDDNFETKVSVFPEGAKIVTSEISGDYVCKKAKHNGMNRNKVDAIPPEPEKDKNPNQLDNKHVEKPWKSLKRNPIQKAQNEDRTKPKTKKVINKQYKNILSKIDTGRKNRNKQKPTEENYETTKPINETERCNFAVQTSKPHQDGSGDINTDNVQRHVEQEKLERFRRINMKIIEAVSKVEEKDSKGDMLSESDDCDSELESLEEIRKEVFEEETEEELNKEAVKSCLFLNRTYPNYFQHLIVRYQLNVPTTDRKELKMRKTDIIRIASEGSDKLGRLENMYKQTVVKNPVTIFYDESSFCH